VTLCSIGVIRRYKVFLASHPEDDIPVADEQTRWQRLQQSGGDTDGWLSHDPSAYRRRGNGRQAEAGSGPGSPRGLVLRSASSRFLICARTRPSSAARSVSRSRVEVHLSDENSHKSGQDDKRCMTASRVAVHRRHASGSDPCSSRRPDDPRRHPQALAMDQASLRRRAPTGVNSASPARKAGQSTPCKDTRRQSVHKRRYSNAIAER
jgi:hypothetical protein